MGGMTCLLGHIHSLLRWYAIMLKSRLMCFVVEVALCAERK